ncbi:MAG: QsdR family transcriptional regulator [Pseudomonadales bacterium]
MGEVLSSLIDDSYKQIIANTSTTGSKRILEVIERGMAASNSFQPLCRFLSKDAQLGLKIVASKHSPVQARTIANLEKLLQEEIDLGHMVLPVSSAVMAYSLTRMIESFLYADLITGEVPDLENASKIIKLMLRQVA